MATYKRRGYKSKTNKQEQANQHQDSTTAEVFSSLDETASKTEQWVAKYQKYTITLSKAQSVQSKLKSDCRL